MITQNQVEAVKQYVGRAPNLNRTKNCNTCYGDGKVRMWPNNGEPLYSDGRGGYNRYDRSIKQMKPVKKITVPCGCTK